MMRWIAFVGGAAVLGGGAWYFGRPETSPVVPQVVPVVASAPTPDAPKDLPPSKVVQVIDLTRAYEPAPEPAAAPGVDVAQFIEAGTAPTRMPYADVQVRPASFWTGAEPAGPERLKVMPREVDPFHLLHEDDPNARVAQLLNESEDLRQARAEMHRFWMNNQASVLTYERVGGETVASQKLDIMPRVLFGGLLNFVPTPTEPWLRGEKWVVQNPDGSLRLPRFVARGLPYPPEWEKLLGQIDPMSKWIPVESLTVMPREISTWPTHCGQPTKLEYERVSGAIGP